MGEAGLHEATTYIAVSMIFYQTLSIGGGEVALNGKMSLSSLCGLAKKLAKNPMLISCVAGVGAALVGIPIPSIVDETMKLVTGAATAVALLALGGTINVPRMSQVFEIIRRTWFDILMKLVANPLIMWGALLLFPVERDLMRVTVMLSSLPSAVNGFIIARGMGMDGDYAADMVAATTLLGIISIPAWAYALGIV